MDIKKKEVIRVDLHVHDITNASITFVLFRGPRA